MPSYLLEPPMDPGPPPAWPGSAWVGAVDTSGQMVDRITLVGAAGYQRARLLVRKGRQPRGFVELRVREGSVSVEDLQRQGAALPEPPENQAPALLPPVTVILCTRDRPGPLRMALTSLLALDYPRFEIIVVDNASTTEASADVVASIGDARIRLVKEPRPGLARARNRGVLASSNDIVAFTDDDVVVDRWWLRGLMDGFASGSGVACVCGMVPSAELRSFPQAYFDRRVTWARSCSPQTYSLSSPPPNQPLFPFQVGQYGTGANFAMRRDVVTALGGFDEALGVGSPTRGGEDIDMFVRVLLAGYQLVYQPSALVWHRHRADMLSLHDQISGYGLGLGAWITKLLCDRRTAPMVVQRAWGGINHAREMTRVSVDRGRLPTELRAGGHLRVTELWAMVRGPAAYARARLSGARKAPLRAYPLEGRAALPDGDPSHGHALRK
jgi:GT2 family glycosyltransferase